MDHAVERSMGKAAQSYQSCSWSAGRVRTDFSRPQRHVNGLFYGSSSQLCPGHKAGNQFDSLIYSLPVNKFWDAASELRTSKTCLRGDVTVRLRRLVCFFSLVRQSGFQVSVVSVRTDKVPVHEKTVRRALICVRVL